MNMAPSPEILPRTKQGLVAAGLRQISGRLGPGRCGEDGGLGELTVQSRAEQNSGHRAGTLGTWPWSTLWAGDKQASPIPLTPCAGSGQAVVVSGAGPGKKGAGAQVPGEGAGGGGRD